jgi:sulfatase modifying factor 1
MRIYQPKVLLFIASSFLLMNCQEQKKSSDTTATPIDGPPGMVWVPGGEFTMGGLEGDREARPDEYPAHNVQVTGFWMDATEITNAEFKKFVDATGYVTTGEKKPEWAELQKQVPPGTPKPHDSLLVAACMVFTTAKTDNLNDWSQWWEWVPAASWKNPQGPKSSIEGKDDYPVVQISWDDAVAYLNWAGKRLPSEAEWEFAARGGKVGAMFPWGDDKNITLCANTWNGKFPEYNTKEDGFERSAPVKSFKPNGYGLYDMGGNVWEWTADLYNTDYYNECKRNGLLTNPTGATISYDPANPYAIQRVQRGGSFLCNPSYCSSYRASARMHSSPDTGQDHVGFRGIMSNEEWEKIKATKTK